MSNAFDSTNYPTKEPVVIIAGDRAAWKRTDLGADYPTASYALTYSARIEGTTTSEISISATESGSDYLIEIGKSVTGSWTVGRYHWQAYITRSSDSERVTVGTGMFEVIANADTATTDTRSHARITLTNIQTAIQAISSKTSSSYTINGRQMTYADLPKLESMRAQYQAMVNSEDRKANGTGGGKLVVKFTR